MSYLQSQEEQQGEHVYADFDRSLEIGRYNENVIAHEFAYQGVPLTPTPPGHPFDFYLPSGKSLEVKIDLRSQCTGAGAIEWPTLARRADFYLYTLTYARVYPHALLEQLYMSGKIPDGGFGGAGYDGRWVRGMGRQGVPMYEFINSLKN